MACASGLGARNGSLVRNRRFLDEQIGREPVAGFRGGRPARNPDVWMSRGRPRPLPGRAERNPWVGAGQEAFLETDRLACARGRARDRLSLPLARAAEAFVRMEAWRPFGYARLADHARERFGCSSRWVQ